MSPFARHARHIRHLLSHSLGAAGAALLLALCRA